MPENEITIAEVQQSLLKSMHGLIADAVLSTSDAAEEYASAARQLAETYRLLDGA